MRDSQAQLLDYADATAKPNRFTSQKVCVLLSILVAAMAAANDLGLWLGLFNGSPAVLVAAFAVIPLALAGIILGFFAIHYKHAYVGAASIAISLASLLALVWMIVDVVSSWHGRLPIAC